MRYRLLPLVLLALMPFVARASLEITEIMYDASGADAGYEWIEVYNAGSTSIDVSAWKFRESGTAHRLTLYGSGSPSLAPRAYAVIADDPSKFSSAYDSFSGLLFDSSFSLSNEGEILELLDEVGEVQFSTTYTNGAASGDGNSLNRAPGSSSWVARSPSPALAMSSSQETSTSSPSSSSEGEKVTIAEPHSTEDREVKLEEKDPSISLPTDVYAFAEDEVEYELELVGYHPEGTTYSWNFGDGTIASGERADHTFKVPGTYLVVVVMELPDGTEREARSVAHILPLTIEVDISSYKGETFIELTNSSPEELDMDGWSIIAGLHQVVLPPHTVVLPEASAVIPLAGLTGSETIFVLDEDNELVATNREALASPEPSEPAMSDTPQAPSDAPTAPRGSVAFDVKEQEVLRQEALRAGARGSSGGSSASSEEGLRVEEGDDSSSQGAAALLAIEKNHASLPGPSDSEETALGRSKWLIILSLILCGGAIYLLYRPHFKTRISRARGFDVEEE